MRMQACGRGAIRVPADRRPRRRLDRLRGTAREYPKVASQGEPGEIFIRVRAIPGPPHGVCDSVAPIGQMAYGVATRFPDQVGARGWRPAAPRCDQLDVAVAVANRRARTASPPSCEGDVRGGRERTRRRRARSFAHTTPSPRSSAGPNEPSVSSTGMPPTCAMGITGRSQSCSRRPGGAPRGLARDRRVGRGSRRRSPGRSPCRRRARS